ncbi:cilia- and flagella-associated protein 99 isoform X2 [Gouania willdenowi]|uniref:Cilia- and flagella-associated protein 99 n=1 Tax=Gouania willdenowi TaxID=441366 RepID=A0A8C5DXN2_GOUWI|nr:cilia- and flagella-associated protein 99 isoform X2 [Gouania willdenowi]
MTSNYGSLVKEAIALLHKFKPERHCLDDFIENAGRNLQTLSSPQRNFVLDIVSGCIEHKKLLDVVIKEFYEQHGQNLFRSESSQFEIVCYLATFALDDLGLQCFSSIVKSLHLKKMLTFLSFFLSNLNWIQDEWSNIYDAEFVVEQWIDPLVRWRPEINILLDQIAEKIHQGSCLKKLPIQTTVPKEFSLAKPKPRRPPSPEVIPKHIKSKRVPESTYVPPKVTQKMEEVKQRNRQQAEELLFDANVQQFRCANPHKSEHSKRVKAQIEEENNSKLKFNSFQSSGCPDIKKTCHIKLNKAAIRRKEAHFVRQLDEELQRKEKLQGGHGPSSFLQWQKEIIQKDLLEKRSQDERRRFDAQIRNKRVGVLRLQIAGQNQKTAQQQKEETAQLMKKYAEKRLQDEKTVRDLVQQIAEGHNNSKAAKEKLKKLKQSIVREVAEQNQELLRQALEKAEAELSRKFEIIQEIHSIETLPRVKVKHFDEAETAGHRFLDEMSVMELKERLAHLKKARQKEEEDKRKRILEEKRKEKQREQEVLDQMALQETIFAQARVAARNAKRKELKEQEDYINQLVAQDETIVAMKKKLQEATEELQRSKENERKKVQQPRTSNRQAEKK